MNHALTNNRPRLINWIIQHELTLFFVFTFLLTWTLYGFVAVTNIENKYTVSVILLIGAYAPSISAIVLSAIANPEPTKIRAGQWFMLFVPVLILAAGIEVLDHICWKHQIDVGLIFASAVLVLLAAFVMTRL